jgi:SAM-dependent methyltransferase
VLPGKTIFSLRNISMSQKTTGWRSILSMPRIYSLCQNLLGGTRAQEEFIEKYIRPEPDMRILDLGCGPADILELLPQNIHYAGVDFSPEYIQAAKVKYGSLGEFYCRPVEELLDSGMTGFDLVMGLGVIHHLDDKQATSFFGTAARALNEKGRCLTVDPCLVPGQHPIARILIRMDRGQNVRSADEYSSLARIFFSQVSQNVRHDRLRLPYTHHIMECRK